MKYKWFCGDCYHTWLTEPGAEQVQYLCQECESPNTKFQGAVHLQNWEVTRKWKVQAYTHHDAVEKTRNFNHHYVRTLKLAEEEE